MDLKRVDLNLLVTLDALLQEAHVSRAARRLGLSQPATSSALDRCRRLFDDPLLLRAAGGMQLTPKAQKLREELQPLLGSIRSVLEIDSHPLSEVSQTLRISASDSVLVRLAAPLIGHLTEVAPGVDLVFTPWFGPGRALDALAGGEVELAISQFPQAGASITTRVIGHHNYEVIMRRDHPAASGFDLEAWLRWPHVMVSGRGEKHSTVDQLLHTMGRSRRVAVIVPNFVVVPPLVARTDLIATLPSGVVQERQRDMLAAFSPPLRIDDYALHVAWHRRLDNDALVQHVAGWLADHYGEF